MASINTMWLQGTLSQECTCSEFMVIIAVSLPRLSILVDFCLLSVTDYKLWFGAYRQANDEEFSLDYVDTPDKQLKTLL